jgi:integrase
MRAKLTLELLNNPPIPEKGSIVVWDESPKGFGLAVTSNGACSYVFNYRFKGRQRRLHLKPGLSLSEAREQAKKLQGEVAQGRDPLAERRKVEADETTTFRHISQEYFELEGPSLRSKDDREALINRHVMPKFGRRQVEEITRLEITRLIDRVQLSSGPHAANAVMWLIKRIFNWHAERSNFKSPLRTTTKPRGEPSIRKRKLLDHEIKAIWEAAEDSPTLFSRMVQLLLLTACRRDEVADMRRSEIEGTCWTIPSSRYKTKIDVEIPLSPAAMKVLEAIERIGRSDLVFTLNGRTSIKGFTVWKRDFDQKCGFSNWQLRDLRRTARSIMSRGDLGIPSDHVERCLGHVIGGTRKHYDQHKYLGEKRHAFEALALEIQRIVTPPSNVTKLRA